MMISALLNVPVLVVVGETLLITDYFMVDQVIGAKDSEIAQRCCPPPRRCNLYAFIIREIKCIAVY